MNNNNVEVVWYKHLLFKSIVAQMGKNSNIVLTNQKISS